MTINQDKIKLAKAVDDFAQKMKEKLFSKVDQGYYGWHIKSNKTNITGGLDRHVKKQWSNGNQEIDIANFAMMLHFINNT